MTTLKCPYSEIELKIAAISMIEKMNKIVEERGDEADKTVRSLIPEPENLSKEAAAHYGISVLDYVNSPNYEKLKDDFLVSQFSKFIQAMDREFGLTEKEAWALALFNQLNR